MPEVKEPCAGVCAGAEAADVDDSEAAEGTNVAEPAGLMGAADLVDDAEEIEDGVGAGARDAASCAEGCAGAGEYRGAETAGRTDLSRFSDSAAVADYARDALAWAVSAGLLQGRSDGTLDPSGSATRAQTAVILQRLETLLEKN